MTRPVPADEIEAIVGASRTGQVDDALTASQAKLSPETIAALEAFAPAPGDAVA